MQQRVKLTAANILYRTLQKIHIRFLSTCIASLEYNQNILKWVQVKQSVTDESDRLTKMIHSFVASNVPSDRVIESIDPNQHIHTHTHTHTHTHIHTHDDDLNHVG
eukprot:GHVR01106415.1.p1 GENE.GHVR01106415.1~~GHVR01106415.1.p1  ORF type:complete len:106 (+),score=45.45 GHVR01106415.1:146-463(+)